MDARDPQRQDTPAAPDRDTYPRLDAIVQHGPGVTTSLVGRALAEDSPVLGAHVSRMIEQLDGEGPVLIAVWSTDALAAQGQLADALGHPVESPRCQHVSPSPWGDAQCVLAAGHDEAHAYSPGEALDGG